VKAYREPEDFWFKYSEPVEGTGGDDRKRYNWTKILLMLKVIKRVTDDADVDRARSTEVQRSLLSTSHIARGAKLLFSRRVQRLLESYER
jgi:hypothetical protein